MVYIKHDLVVPYKSWQEWMLKSESLFSKELLNYFYSKEEMTRRCVLEGDLVLTPHRIHKRVKISPKKSDAIERKLTYILCVILEVHERTTTFNYCHFFLGCLRYHCNKHKIKDEHEINKRLAKKNRYFTEEINKYLKAARTNLKNDNNK